METDKFLFLLLSFSLENLDLSLDFGAVFMVGDN
jgi:hypothetical protein